MPLFYTADTLDTVDAVYFLQFNNSQWFLQAVESCLILMTDPNNWEQVGTITVPLAAAAASEMYYNFRMTYDNTATIVPYAYLKANLPPQLLDCDGSLYNTVDYPVLFGVIGYTFGGSGAQFAVPDLRGRVPVGQGAGTGLTARALADSGGEENHTLTVTELAAHTHTNTPHSHAYSSAGPNLTTVGPGAPQPTAVPFPSGTGFTGISIDNAGGGAAHNNVQPFTVIGYAIVTGQ